MGSWKKEKRTASWWFQAKICASKIGNYFFWFSVIKTQNDKKTYHVESCLHLIRLCCEKLTVPTNFQVPPKLPSQNQFQPSVSNFQHLLKILVLRWVRRHFHGPTPPPTIQRLPGCSPQLGPRVLRPWRLPLLQLRCPRGLQGGGLGSHGVVLDMGTVPANVKKVAISTSRCCFFVKSPGEFFSGGFGKWWKNMWPAQILLEKGKKLITSVDCKGFHWTLTSFMNQRSFQWWP